MTPEAEARTVRNAEIVSRYRDGALMREIAAEHGVTVARVGQIIRRAEDIGQLPRGLTFQRRAEYAASGVGTSAMIAAGQAVLKARSAALWPPGVCAKVRQLAALGYTAAEIGVPVGKTRNAIIGWCYRNDVALGRRRAA